jgi:HEAT repeat protein
MHLENKVRYSIIKLTIILAFISLCLLPFGHLQADDIDKLVQNLTNEDVIVRLNAAKALGEMKDARAVEPLIMTLKDEKCGSMAANALVKIGKPSVSPLIAALKDDDPIVRRNATKALGEIKDAGAVEPLINSLKDSDLIVRRNAAKALGEIKDMRAVEPLIVSLKDDSAVVRRNAAESLGEIKDSRATESLVTCLKDGDAIVRKNAALALKEIGAPGSVADILY